MDIYASSTAEFPNGVKLEVLSGLPGNGKVNVKVLEAKQPFMLKLRVPRWAAENRRSCYLTHENVTAGMEFDMEFPFRFKVTRYTGGEEIRGKERYALEYGPILFAAMGAPNPITIRFDPDRPEEWFIPVKRITPDGVRPALRLRGDNRHEYWAYMDIYDEPFDVYPIVE